jgi:hypothetical protein
VLKETNQTKPKEFKMSVFTKKQLIDGYIDCTSIGHHEVNLQHYGSWFIVKHYEKNELIFKMRCDTYREAVRLYTDKVTELKNKFN